MDADGVLRVEYRTRLSDLGGRLAIKHRYSFPRLNEVRETGFLLGPERPEATSRVLIAMDGERTGYFNVAAHDDEDHVMAGSVLTYDRRGRVRPYAARTVDAFVSPLDLGDASLQEERDERGRAVLRLRLELRGLAVPADVNQLSAAHESQPRRTLISWGSATSGPSISGCQCFSHSTTSGPA